MPTKPLFVQMREARKANAIPWELIKAVQKIGELYPTRKDVMHIREIISDWKELNKYGLYPNKLRYIKREVKWYKLNNYLVLF